LGVQFHKYEKSKAITTYEDFPGRSHFTVGQEGWEVVADFTLQWATENASKSTATAAR
jgi:hypothetical protein